MFVFSSVICGVFLGFANYVVLVQTLTCVSLIFLLGSRARLRATVAWNALVIPLLTLLPGYFTGTSLSQFLTLQKDLGGDAALMLFLGTSPGYLYFAIPIQIAATLVLAVIGSAILRQPLPVFQNTLHFRIVDICLVITLLGVSLASVIALVGGTTNIAFVFQHAGSILFDSRLGYVFFCDPLSYGVLSVVVLFCYSLRIMKVRQIVILAVAIMALMRTGVEVLNGLSIPDYADLMGIGSRAFLAGLGVIASAVVASVSYVLISPLGTTSNQT